MLNFLVFVTSLFTKIITTLGNLKKRFSKEKNVKSFTDKLINMLANIGLIISTLLGFLVMLPIIMQVILVVFILLVIVAVILIIISVATLGNDTGYDDMGGSSPSNQNVGSSLTGGLAYTEEELEMYGQALTGYEKNIYRLGIVARHSVDGYGGKQYFADYDKRVNVTFVLGISSTETGMSFYNAKGWNEEKNILKDPSDKPLNSLGFGVFGLCGRTGDCYTSGGSFASKQYKLDVLAQAEKAAIVGKWGEPSRSNDINFYPYASYFAVQHLNGKTTVVDKYIDRAMKVIKEEWGITQNLEEHKAVIYHMLVQAAYHGVNLDAEVEAYASMWGALLHASSDVDAERSFYRWSIDPTYTDYSESSLRISMFGKTKGNASKSSNPSEWTGTKTPILLNGVKLDVPVYKFLHDKYKDNATYNVGMNQLLKWWLNFKGTGVNARALNFHYGLNSFLQGNKAETLLLSKMSIPVIVTSEGDVTTSSGGGGGSITAQTLKLGVKLRPDMIPKGQAGQPQGTVTIDGKTESMASYLARTYAKSYTSYYNKLLPTTATNVYFTPKSPTKEFKYEDYNFFNIPYNKQGGKKEAYGGMPYGATTSSTIDGVGCMYYSMSYAATALTGKNINTAEIILFMQGRGHSLRNGMSQDGKHGQVIKELNGGNAKYKHITSTTHAQTMVKVTDELNKGGALAVIRLGPKHGYAYGVNHYVVLTGVHRLEDGSLAYSMYSSSSVAHSTQLHTLKHLSESPGNNGSYPATVFYYN